MATIMNGEQHAIREVIAAGERYGFGNLIAHLRAAWAKSLIESTKGIEGQSEWTEEQANQATITDAYPIRLHLEFLGEPAQMADSEASK